MVDDSMADVHTPKQRRYNMSRIRGRDTKPEMIVRKAVHAMGYRFRLHQRNLPGKPDLVFPSRRKIIFVHGCFWHYHNCPAGRVKPKTNSDFWAEKIKQNTERDCKHMAALKSLGWDVLVVWECQIRDKANTIKRITTFLD